MTKTEMERRDFLKTVLAGLPACTFNWNLFPRGDGAKLHGSTWDAVIPSGLQCFGEIMKEWGE